MNYLLGLIALLAVIICIASFPVPTLVALAFAGLWWAFKGRKGRVQ